LNTDKIPDNNTPYNDQFDDIAYDRKNTEDTRKLIEGMCKMIYHGFKYLQNQEIRQQTYKEIEKGYKQLFKEYDEFYKRFRF
jgi:hypothetical protein